MEAREYLKLSTDNTEAGDLIKENNLTEAVIKMLDYYAEIRVKNCSIPAVIDMCCPYCKSKDIIWHGKTDDCRCNDCGKTGSIIL
jgi:hypothetical protein